MSLHWNVFSLAQFCLPLIREKSRCNFEFPAQKANNNQELTQNIAKKVENVFQHFMRANFLEKKILNSKRPSSPFPIHDHIFSISPFPLLGISFVWHFPSPSFGNRSRKGGGWKELSIQVGPIQLDEDRRETQSRSHFRETWRFSCSPQTKNGCLLSSTTL